LSINFSTLIAESARIYLLFEPKGPILSLGVGLDQDREAGTCLSSGAVIHLQRACEVRRTGTVSEELAISALIPRNCSVCFKSSGRGGCWLAAGGGDVSEPGRSSACRRGLRVGLRLWLWVKHLVSRGCSAPVAVCSVGDGLRWRAGGWPPQKKRTPRKALGTRCERFHPEPCQERGKG